MYIAYDGGGWAIANQRGELSDSHRNYGVVGARDYFFYFSVLACIAIFGFALSIDAPYVWRGEVRAGLIFELIALAFIFAAILLLRGSIRRLRSLRQMRMGERATGPDTNMQ